MTYDVKNKATVCSHSMSLSKFQSDQCMKLIDKLINMKICSPFVDLVDPKKDGAPDYYEIIKNPMSLNEVKNHIREKRYKDIKEFVAEVNLIWENAKTYNGEGAQITLLGMEASCWFNRKMKHFPSTVEEEWMRKVQKIVRSFSEALAHPPPELLNPKTPLKQEEEKAKSQDAKNISALLED